MTRKSHLSRIVNSIVKIHHLCWLTGTSVGKLEGFCVSIALTVKLVKHRVTQPDGAVAARLRCRGKVAVGQVDVGMVPSLD